MRYILTRIATVISTYLYRDEELDLFFRPLPVYTLMACVENVMKNDKYGLDLTCHMRGIPPPPLSLNIEIHFAADMLWTGEDGETDG